MRKPHKYWVVGFKDWSGYYIVAVLDTYDSREGVKVWEDRGYTVVHSRNNPISPLLDHAN